MAKKGEITPERIEAFARSYVLGSNSQAQAWRDAHPNSKAKDESVHVAATRFAADPRVKLRIKELEIESRKQSEEEFKVTAAQKKQALLSIITQAALLKADLTPKDLQDPDIKPQYSAAVAAIAELNRMDGDHAAIKQEVKNNITGSPGVWQVELVKPKDKS